MLKFIYIFSYILLNAYVLWRTLRWFRLCHGGFKRWRFRIIYIVLFSVMASLVILAFFLQKSGQYPSLESFSSKWFGVLLYIIFYVAVADLLRFLAKLMIRPKDFFGRKKVVFIGGMVVIVLIVSTSIYGFVHVKDMKTVNYKIFVEKECTDLNSMRIVLVADQHLGYTMGVCDMEKMVQKINEAKPDLVCLAGDIFDNNYDALDDPEGIKEAWKSIESTYGVYACWGNHDVKESLFSGFSVDKRSKALRDERMDKLLEAANITVLSDEVKLVADRFYIIGRLDYEKAGDGTSNRKSITKLMQGINSSKPVILMDHEPRELDKTARTGVDIDLSGHTHAGQIFPLNLINHIAWENGYGVLKKENMYSIVTSGVGVYGPAMRVFTDSEVAVIHVEFQKFLKTE